MGMHIRITAGSYDRHVLAGWWAETLDRSAEPADEAFIRHLIDEIDASDADTRVVNGALVWLDGAAIRPTGQLDWTPRQRLVLQLVPEPGTMENRVHRDMNLTEAAADKDTLRAALEGCGARFPDQASQGPFTWYTMADPEGNELCLA